MLGFPVNLDGDNAWPDLQQQREKIIHLTDPDWQLAALDGGMTSGKPSVSLRINLPDGRIVIAETSMALWVATARILVGRFGDPAGW